MRTNLTLSFNRESIVNSEQAGILTCNSFYHPSRLGSGCLLLTVARQFVIYTRFPINPQLSKTFSDF
jgi:hypothetical protein